MGVAGTGVGLLSADLRGLSNGLHHFSLDCLGPTVMHGFCPKKGKEACL